MSRESSRSSQRSEEKLRILLPAETLRRRVTELAEEIDRFYAGREVLVVVVLRGAFVFAADLVRQLHVPVEIDFVQLESYGSEMRSSRQVRVRSDVSTPVEDRDVLVIEDIADSGYSLDFLVNYLHDRGAHEVTVCALLDKPSRREVDVDIHFAGFAIPDVFVVGYGIDYAQRYRSLPDICALSKED